MQIPSLLEWNDIRAGVRVRPRQPESLQHRSATDLCFGERDYLLLLGSDAFMLQCMNATRNKFSSDIAHNHSPCPTNLAPAGTLRAESAKHLIPRARDDVQKLFSGNAAVAIRVVCLTCDWQCPYCYCVDHDREMHFVDNE